MDTGIKIDGRTGVLYKQWDAPSPRAVLLLVHGLGGHSDRWEFLGQFLLHSGISSYAIELKGFGQTQDLKGHIDSFRTYFDDIRCLRMIINGEHPRAKIFILGESLGGLLAFLLSIREPELFQGLICISPAFKGDLKFSPFTKIKVFLSLVFNPQRQFRVPFTAQMVTRDPSYQIVMDQEIKEHRLASARLLINILAAEMRAEFLKNQLRIPTLFLVAGKDFLVDSRASLRIFKELKVADKSIIRYPEMYHALSIDLGRERVFSDIIKWVHQRSR
jgi:alpha-beta hydrolase superfamily lysophospholipase